MKSNDQLRKEFEEQTGNKAIVFPACHGETGYASWEYQLWLEQKLLEEYAQQSQPSGMRWVDGVNKIRGQAKAFGDKYSGSISEQAAAEVGFNAAINQVINILSESSPAGADEVKNSTGFVSVIQNEVAHFYPAGAAEGASEGMAEALAKFFAKECKVGDPLLPIIDSIYDDWKLVYDKLRIETSFSEAAIQANKFVIEKYASLSPGVEDNQTKC